MSDPAPARRWPGVWLAITLSAGRVLRVRRSFEGRDDSVRDVATGHRKIEVIPGTEGFVVKAYTRGKGGSENLFDSMSNARAQELASAAEQLIMPCPVRA